MEDFASFRTLRNDSLHGEPSKKFQGVKNQESYVKSEKEYVVNHTTNLYLLSKTSKLENILPMGMRLKEKIQIIKELITD